MLIGFVGDAHGCVYDLFSALARWQKELGNQLDLIVQVGDMGAFPKDDALDSATALYAQLDHAERDFARYLQTDAGQLETLRRLRNEFRGPIHFINGKHDDVAWLYSLLDPQSD